MTLVIKRGLLCKREPSFFGGTTWVQQHVYVTRTGWMHLFQNNTIASSGAAQGLPLPGAQPQLSIRLDGCSLKVERRSDPSAVEADAALMTKAAAEAAKAKEEAKVKEGGEEAVEEVAALEETVVEVAPAAKVAADEFMEEIASQVTLTAAAPALFLHASSTAPALPFTYASITLFPSHSLSLTLSYRFSGRPSFCGRAGVTNAHNRPRGERRRYTARVCMRRAGGGGRVAGGDCALHEW